jgi:hypothetical protein
MQSSRFAAAALAFVLFAPRANAADYINDPLTSATMGGRGSSGGSFSASGWTTVTETDTVWYEIADALETASVEYEVSGVSVGGSLIGADHDVLCVYQATTGSTEPSPYAPDFRNNDFKVFTRIFGTAEPGRGGAMKVELHICPRGVPWHHDAPCADSCYTGGLAYANGSDKDIGWDAAKTYRMGLRWGGGKMILSRDGADLSTVTYTGTYAPKPLRVRLGSPRHKLGSVEAMPKGLTFKNVKMTGTAGVMTPVCGAPVIPDSGPTADTGPAPDAATTSGVVEVLQDVTIDGNITGVSPDVNDLATGVSKESILLMFPPVSGTVKRAILRMHTTSSASATGGSGAVHAVSDTSWSETTVTWATKPAWAPMGVGPERTVDPDQDVEWDVTSLVAGGTRAFAIVSTDTNGSHYLSKEADKARGPKLLLELGPPTPSTDASVPPDDAMSIDDSGNDAGPVDGSAGGFLNDERAAEGCGCHTPQKTTTTPWYLGIVALVFFKRRNQSSIGA